MLYLSRAAGAMVAGRSAVVSDASSGLLVDRLLATGMADPVIERLPDIDPASVTVVIPAFGRPDALDRLLDSIGPHYKVIVVDDCSPAAAAIKMVCEKHQAELVRLALNKGPAGARNEGLRKVSTRFVAFADSDVVVDSQTIAVLLKHFHDPQVVLAGPRVRGLASGGKLNWIQRYEEARSSLDLGEYPATVRPRSPVSWLPGAFLLARVDALGAGFIEGARVGEDVELVWRLVEQGGRVRFEPQATVWHEHRRTVLTWLSRKVFYGSSAHFLSLKHPNAVAPAVFSPWSVAAVAVLLFQRRWSVPVCVAISVLASWRIFKKLRKSAHPASLAAGLTGRGLLAAVAQTMALLVRHSWPIALTGSFFSRRLRRALVASAIIDAGLEYVRTKPRLDLPRFALARRLDDLAYGTGVWVGALRGRSLRPLLPDIRSHPH